MTLALVLGIVLLTVPCHAQMPSFESRQGEETLGWRLDRVEQHNEFVRLHFTRGGESAHLEINSRALNSGQVRTRRFSIQPAPEGFAPPELQEAVLQQLQEIEQSNAPMTTAVDPQHTSAWRGVLALQALLLLAVVLAGVGVLSEVFRRRRVNSIEGTRACSCRDHALPLLLVTVCGALLRVTGGIRIPGFEGGHGHAHGFGDMAAVLDRQTVHVDSHGGGPAALAGLFFELIPASEAAWIGLQVTLGTLTIPLVYFGSLGWLRSTREATWGAAIYASLPCASYFAMTEVRTIPGAFFVTLSVALTGFGLATKRASLLASAGLFAVFATTFHPVLAAAPLVGALLVVVHKDARSLIATRRAQLAFAGIGAAWAVVLRLVAEQLASKSGEFGAESVAAWVVHRFFTLLLPTFGFEASFGQNAFLNTYATPPLVIVAWYLGVAAVRHRPRRRALLALCVAALGMTLPGMLGLRLNPARLQQAAAPLHAMIAGVGVVSMMEWFTTKITRSEVHRYIPVLLAAALGLSTVTSSGPRFDTFVYENERHVVLRALPALTEACVVFVPPTVDGGYWDFPSYLTREHGAPLHWRTLQPTDSVAGRVSEQLRRGCALYYRPSVCWSQREHEPPATPDPRAIRTECAATEAQLVLEPLHIESINALPAAAATYRRPQIEVGFFRIRALVAGGPPP